jgi:uncharacterized protein
MTKKVPIRSCVACGEKKAKKELIRIVLKENEILIDNVGKLPGRGAYICPNKECIEKAQRYKKLDNALKISIPDEVYKKLMEEIDNE